MVRIGRHASGDDSAPSESLRPAVVAHAGARTGADALTNIIGATASLLGSTFLSRVVLHAALELDVDHACVWEAIDPTLVRVVAASDPALVGSVQEVAKTPCGEVLRDGSSVLFGDHVSKRFPEDEWLVEQDLRGFLGLPLAATDGKIIGVLAVATRTPIHESLEMETTLRALVPRIAGELERLQRDTTVRRDEEDFRSESRLHNVIDALPDMIFRMDASGTYRDFVPSNAISPMVPPDAFLGRNVAEIVPEELAVSTLRSIHLALELREAQRIAYSLSIEGERQYFEARIVPVEDDEVLAFVRDVTNPHLPAGGERGQQSDERESQLHSVIAALPDMIFRMDASGTYRDFIPSTHVSPMVPPDAFLGRNVAEIMPEQVAVACLRAIHVALELRESQRIAYSLSIAGTRQYREVRIVPIGDDEVLAFVRDVNDQYLPDRGGRGQQRRPRGEDIANKYQVPYGLTHRELSVLHHVARGMADKEIAEALGISVFTVNKHVAAILSKMGVPSRTAAGVNAVRQGMLMNEPDASAF